MHLVRATTAIARDTLIESIRNRILLVAVAFSVVLVMLSVAAASVSIGEQSRIIIDAGLAASSLFGTIIAIALTVSAFSAEIRDRTAYPVLARPIPRWIFVLGKYIGLTAAMEFVVIIMMLSTAGIVLLYGDTPPPAFWGSMWLTCFEIALVVGVALLFSTLSVPVLAATYAAGFMLSGNFAEDVARLASRLARDGDPLAFVARVTYYILPNVEELSLRTQAANRLPIPDGIVMNGAFYGTMYAAIFVCLAMVKFNQREIV